MNEARQQIFATRKRSEGGGDDRIVVGVVMERLGNHSPHRLVQGVLESMDRSKFHLVAFSRDYATDYPDAGQAILRAVEEVVLLEWHKFATGLSDPFADRRLIAKAKVDVLIYAALGNTLSSHLLALGRLAPVQIAFGHGHPVTSGSPGIDYFVSSDLFETAASTYAREARGIAGAASDISQAATTVTRALEAAAETAYAGDKGGVDDGTNHIISSATSYARTTAGSDRRQPGPRRDPKTASKKNEEAGVEGGNGDGGPGRGKGGGNTEQDFTEQLVLFDSLTASLPEVFGPRNAPSGTAALLAAAGESSSALGSPSEEHHLYHCIQHSKKFHPDFDPVLRGILEGDPAAKILLTTGSKMLAVVANCDVMLDTFPWGAGVTAMEALSAGVPVVTLPARIAVLPLALGQVIELGVENELVASNVDDMVNKAVNLASDDAYRISVSSAILDKKDRLSDPHRPAREWERFLERAVRSAIQLDTRL
eukprot:g2715.t1